MTVPTRRISVSLVPASGQITRPTPRNDSFMPPDMTTPFAPLVPRFVQSVPLGFRHSQNSA